MLLYNPLPPSLANNKGIIFLHVCVCWIQAHNGERFCLFINPYQVGGEIMFDDCEGSQHFYIFWLYYINMMKLMFLVNLTFFVYVFSY